MMIYIFNEKRRGSVYGVGTYIRELAAALKNRNMQVCVINLISDKPQIQTEETDGITQWHFPAPIPDPQKIHSQEQTGLYLRNVAYLLQWYIQDKKDLIFHLNFLHSKILADELKKAFDCRLALSIHYFDWGFQLLGNQSRFTHLLETDATLSPADTAVRESYLKEKELFDTVDRIVCLSQNTYQTVSNHYKQEAHKLSVLYNGLSDQRQIGKKHELRRKYRLPKVPVILFAGRVDEVKGVKYIIRAFKKVLETMPHCRLLIAGSGDFQSCMEECETVWTNVTFTGLINKAHLYELYTLADIGVMMSFHEQCSYVAIEMMMHGLPLIGTTSTGLNEMIEEGVSGLHVPVEEYPDKVEINTALLAEKMLSLLQNPQARKRMGRNARKRYEALYTSELMGEKMCRLYQSLNEEPH